MVAHRPGREPHDDQAQTSCTKRESLKPPALASCALRLPSSPKADCIMTGVARRNPPVRLPSLWPPVRINQEGERQWGSRQRKSPAWKRSSVRSPRSGNGLARCYLPHRRWSLILHIRPSSSSVVPLLLGDLEQSSVHWFEALGAITGQDPVSREDWGNISAMRAAWLTWGRSQNLL